MNTGKEEVRIAIRATPGAKRNTIAALKEGVWYIKIAAPPVEGKANEELVAYLSKLFGVRKSNLSVLKGKTSRNKLVSVSGLTQNEVTLRLSAELDE